MHGTSKASPGLKAPCTSDEVVFLNIVVLLIAHYLIGVWVCKASSLAEQTTPSFRLLDEHHRDMFSEIRGRFGVPIIKSDDGLLLCLKGVRIFDMKGVAVQGSLRQIPKD